MGDTARRKPSQWDDEARGHGRHVPSLSTRPVQLCLPRGMEQVASEVRAVQTRLQSGREDRGRPGEHIMGGKAFKLSEADAKKYSEVKSKLERHFVKHRDFRASKIQQSKTRTWRNCGCIYH